MDFIIITLSYMRKQRHRKVTSYPRSHNIQAAMRVFEGKESGYTVSELTPRYSITKERNTRLAQRTWRGCWGTAVPVPRQLRVYLKGREANGVDLLNNRY